MIRKLTIVACLAVSGCAVPIPVSAPIPAPMPVPIPEPMEAPLSAKERFVSSVVANGCSLTGANSDLVMAEAVLSREDLARVMTELQSEGRGQIDGASFRVTGGACA